MQRTEYRVQGPVGAEGGRDCQPAGCQRRHQGRPPRPDEQRASTRPSSQTGLPCREEGNEGLRKEGQGGERGGQGKRSTMPCQPPSSSGAGNDNRMSATSPTHLQLSPDWAAICWASRLMRVCWFQGGLLVESVWCGQQDRDTHQAAACLLLLLRAVCRVLPLPAAVLFWAVVIAALVSLQPAHRIDWPIRLQKYGLKTVVRCACVWKPTARAISTMN